MKTETHMDCLLQRLYDMNSLADLNQEEHDQDTIETSKKKKKGGKKSGGFFSTVVGEIFFRRNSESRAGIIGIIHPSDGHPQEEMAPDFGWFRPLAHNNATWTLYWPELII